MGSFALSNLDKNATKNATNKNKALQSIDLQGFM